MRRYHFSLIVFALLTILLLFLNFRFRIDKSIRSIPETLNTYAVGNIEDYHQYMYILKRGSQGHFLYHNAYSEEQIPDVLLQPFYHIAGYILGKLNISVYDMYFTLHIFALIALLSTIYMLIQKTITKEWSRILAMLFFISATGFYTITTLNPVTMVKHYLPDFNFDLFVKYHVMQPHHDIATALFIIALLALSQQIYTSKHILIGGIAAALLGFIHPYIQLFLFFILIIEHLFRIVLMKREYWASFFKYILPILIAIPTAGITYYVLVYVLRFEIGIKGIITHLPRQQTFYEYSISLGPILFTSLISFCFIRSIVKVPLLRLIFIWAYLPLLLFFLPDYNLPINTWRLFQTYQHIPLAILTAYGLRHTVRQFQKLYIPILLCSICIVVYGTGIYIYSYAQSIKPDYRLNWNVDVPNVLLDVFSYIHTHSAPDDVVLAGGVASNLVPEFTHNRVIIGHNGDNRNFLYKLSEINMFLSQTYPLDEVESMLDRYHVSYILFGIDAPYFKDTKYATVPYLKEVFVEPKTGFSVVSVLRDK